MSAYNTALLLFSLLLMMFMMHHVTATDVNAKETPFPLSGGGCPYGFKRGGTEETPVESSSSTSSSSSSNENTPGNAAREFGKTIRELVLVEQMKHFSELKEIVYKLASVGHSICRPHDIQHDSFWYGKTLDHIIMEALKMNDIRACNTAIGFYLFWSKEKTHPLELECNAIHRQ